jgi:hypothetical protein
MIADKLMTKDEGMTKSEVLWRRRWPLLSLICRVTGLSLLLIWSLGLDSSLVIGHSSFITALAKSVERSHRSIK